MANIKLTPTELRVLLAITEVGAYRRSPRRSACRHDGPDARHRLFDRTGALAADDLLKPVAGYATPLAG